LLATETVAALQAFRKRHSDAERVAGQLNARPTTVDIAHYRSVLKNKAIVDEAEKILRDFKPVTYDVSTHIKAIETFETNAVRNSGASSFFFLYLNAGDKFDLLDCESERDRGEN
jgi:F-type H+-transporting ATPase subunit d